MKTLYLEDHLTYIFVRGYDLKRGRSEGKVERMSGNDVREQRRTHKEGKQTNIGGFGLVWNAQNT